MTDTVTLKDTRRATVERRPFASIGHADHGWLNARHHFSFADYYDPARMGWGNIRVWNDDEIGANSGFPPHPHRDMEIITYVRKGAITHKDSMGNEGRTGAGDVQVMSAGTGVRHAEYNLESETTTLFQIWVLPRAAGGAPSWGAKPFPKDSRSGKFAVLASGYDSDADALRIRADARLLGATVQAGQTLTYDLAEDRYAYLVPATGQVRINGELFEARDGAAIRGGGAIVIEALEDSEVVLVDSQ
ncbi:MAG: pirin family protein [Sphingobium sp.]|uniref:pirin family protein n=1 Tax=Sphingobium sp. TaxID=1912891 RepID=UPI0029B29B8C|nr:pirin family protein [Sphingobium sp.]MDX3909980.1 pirin family protein [Sphingobium sp.]